MTTATTVTASATHVRVPLTRPFATSAGAWHEHDAWIIQLRHPDGRQGHGEATLGPGATRTDLERLASGMRATLADAPAWKDLDQSTASPADPVARAIRSGLEAAALDLDMLDLGAVDVARAAARTIALNATIATEDLEATVAQARDAVRSGFRCLKVKVGSERTTAELGERIGAVRMAVGDGIEIRLDANGAWDATTSIERAKAVADLDIAYIEQPIASDRPEDLAAVRAASPVAIAADEAVSSTDAARALIDARAVDVIVLKLARVGGPTAALSVASAARAAGIRITVSSLLETGVGLAAAARVAGRLSDAADHAHGLATASALESDLLATPMAIDQGRLALPDEPLGLDEEALARWSVERIGDQR